MSCSRKLVFQEYCRLLKVMMIEMQVASVALDIITKNPRLLLKDISDNYFISMDIGQKEAQSIIAAIQNQKSPRPMTHDLFANLLKACHLPLKGVIIHSIEENTFYAYLCVQQGEVIHEIDSRPSDAIALALRTDTPIWATENLLRLAAIPIDEEMENLESFNSKTVLRSAELLQKLKEAIAISVDLGETDKAEALEQIDLLIKVVSQSKDNTTKKTAKTAIKILLGTVAIIPPKAKVVEAYKKFMPEILSLLSL